MEAGAGAGAGAGATPTPPETAGGNDLGAVSAIMKSARERLMDDTEQRGAPGGEGDVNRPPGEGGGECWFPLWVGCAALPGWRPPPVVESLPGTRAKRIYGH